MNKNFITKEIRIHDLLEVETVIEALGILEIDFILETEQGSGLYKITLLIKKEEWNVAKKFSQNDSRSKQR